MEYSNSASWARPELTIDDSINVPDMIISVDGDDHDVSLEEPCNWLNEGFTGPNFWFHNILPVVLPWHSNVYSSKITFWRQSLQGFESVLHSQDSWVRRIEDELSDQELEVLQVNRLEELTKVCSNWGPLELLDNCRHKTVTICCGRLVCFEGETPPVDEGHDFSPNSNAGILLNWKWICHLGSCETVLVFDLETEQF